MKKKRWAVAAILVGIGLLAAAIWLRFGLDAPKGVQGVCMGMGAGLLGMGASNLIMGRMERAQPEVAKRNQIEFADERNTMIRNKAKAKVSDIVQWLVMGIAYATILIGAPLWLTLAAVAVFVLKNALELFFMNKYQKEM